MATERRIPDLLATAGTVGALAKDSGSKTGIEHRKLCMSSMNWYFVRSLLRGDYLYSNGTAMSLLHQYFPRNRS